MPGNSLEDFLLQQTHVTVFPVRESSLPEESMVVRSQMVTCHSEQVANAAVETKKALGLGR